MGREWSVFDVAQFVLRLRRPMLLAATVGGLTLGGWAFLSPRQYQSHVWFTVPSTSGSASRLRAVAMQLGLGTLSDDASTSPELLAQILVSPATLAVVATAEVPTRDGRVVRTTALYAPDAPSPLIGRDRAVRALARFIEVTTDYLTGIVKVAVTAPDPEAARAIAEILLRAASDADRTRRRQEAVAEHRFLQDRVREMGERLATAERRLELFLQRNRTRRTAALVLTEDRFQRDVSYLRDEHARLLTARDNANLRAERDTPVLTVIAPPEAPVRGLGRGTVVRAGIGAVAGATIVLVVGLSMAVRRHERDVVNAT